MRPTPVFFFQAEDGIRDVAVTGVQTCALPIFGIASDDVARILYRPDVSQKDCRSGSRADRKILQVFDIRYDGIDRKSTRLNSSHGYISYAVFCLKKKNNQAQRAVQPRTTCILI